MAVPADNTSPADPVDRTPAVVVGRSSLVAGRHPVGSMVDLVGRSSLGFHQGCRGRRLGGFGAGRREVVHPVVGGC